MFPNSFWASLLLAVLPFSLTEMLTPKGYTNAQCTTYNYLKFQAGKVMVALVVSTGSAKPALHGHYQKQPIPWPLWLWVCSAVAKNHTSSLHQLWRNYFCHYRFLINCYQREINRAAVTLSWIRSNSMYCTKRLQTLWGCTPSNLPLYYICIFSFCPNC